MKGTKPFAMVVCFLLALVWMCIGQMWWEHGNPAMSVLGWCLSAIFAMAGITILVFMLIPTCTKPKPLKTEDGIVMDPNEYVFWLKPNGREASGHAKDWLVGTHVGSRRGFYSTREALRDATKGGNNDGLTR